MAKTSFVAEVTFKPFYIRGVTVNYIEMCCFEKYLYALWSINALIDCAKKQNLDLGNVNTCNIL